MLPGLVALSVGAALAAQRSRGTPISPGDECPPAQTEGRPGNCQAPTLPPPSIVDYRPRSTLVAPEHLVPRAKYPVIDFHGHPGRRLMSQDALSEMVAELDALNVRLIVAADNLSGQRLQDAVSTIAASPQKGRARVLAGIDFRGVGPGWAETAVRQLEADVRVVTRFDRVKGRRTPFLSAMSMLGAKDNESRSYLEFVDVLRRYGAAPTDDMEALWRRVVFTILISNTDDHLRNDAFLYEGQSGWRLSPAYDLNPVPIDIKPRVLTTAITEDDTTASLALALEVAGYFEISESKARAIAAQVAAAALKWRTVAGRHGISRQEIDRMASAFEHRDLEIARGR